MCKLLIDVMMWDGGSDSFWVSKELGILIFDLKIVLIPDSKKIKKK